jgi:hypothetical protein
LITEGVKKAEFKPKYRTMRQHLWFGGQSSWLQIQRSGFDCRCYHIFWEVVCLERGVLSLVGIKEELLGRKSSRSGLEDRDYDRKGSAALPTRHPSLSTKVSTNVADKRRSLRVVRSRTKATRLLLLLLLLLLHRTMKSICFM